MTVYLIVVIAPTLIVSRDAAPAPRPIALGDREETGVRMVVLRVVSGSRVTDANSHVKRRGSVMSGLTVSTTATWTRLAIPALAVTV